MFDKDLYRFGDPPCLITPERTYTYKEVNDLSDELQSAMPREKRLVLVLCQNNIETIIVYLSLLRGNHAFIMLDAMLAEAMIKSIIASYRPHFVWEEKKEGETYGYNFLSYGLKELHTEAIALHEDLSLMLSTSGTTGSPKMVKLTKHNLYSNCESIVEYLRINRQHRTITNLPLHYSYGLSVLNTHLSQGASIVVTDHLIISKPFWELFQTYKVTTLNGVPYTYEILKRIGLMKKQLPSLRYMTQAGGKLHHKLVVEYAKWAQKFGIDFYVMYGQTEATARISYLPPDQVLRKSASIGIAIPRGKLSIRDIESGKPIESSQEEGELIYEGPNVMMGYARSLEDLEKEDQLQGVLHTGDLAYRDDEGYFYITGRLKRFIKLHGNRIGLDEVEQWLKSRFDSIACTGEDNRLIIATTREDKLVSIKKETIQRYGFHHTTISVVYIERMPVTNAGKIDYEALRKVLK